MTAELFKCFQPIKTIEDIEALNEQDQSELAEVLRFEIEEEEEND